MSEQDDAYAQHSAELERQLEARNLQHLRGVIAFGQEVEVFLKTPIGRYLQARAMKSIEEARDRLQEANPTDHVAIAAAQVEAKAAWNVLDWLGEAIREGQAAATNAINAEAQG